MKKINKFILGVIALSLFSCEDATDIEQRGLIQADEAVSNITDLELNLNGLYSSLDNTVAIQLNATYSDEVAIGTSNGGQNVDELSGVLAPTNGKAASIWSSSYNGISQANRVIENSDLLFLETPEESTRINQVKGEALAIRALLHLKLQTYFSTDNTDPNALGVIALDFVPELNQYLPRNTNQEVFTFINNDLDQADQLISTAVTTNNRINSDVVKAIRTRAAAYSGDYATAKTLANELFATYGLDDDFTWFNSFTNEIEGDFIFKLERTPNDGYNTQATAGGGTVGSLFAFRSSSAGGQPFLEMSRGLYNLLEGEISGVRYTRYLDQSTTVDGTYATNPEYLDSDVLVIDKYPGSEGTAQVNDIPLFRGAEMLLILAEAFADEGNYAAVESVISAIRGARNSALAITTPTTEEEAFALILEERRLELAFEGHRWVDLKRLGQRANVSIDRDPRDCALTPECERDVNSYKYTLPIPLREIQINNLLVQNPGY